MDARKVIQRTGEQNNSMHLYFEELASELNDRGITQRALLEKLRWIEAPNTKDSIKALWVEIQVMMYGKEHTSELNIEQVGPVYDVFNKAMSEGYQFHLPFPSKETKGNR